MNSIIHSDYLADSGVLKVIKRKKEFIFSNPGTLKLPLEDIYHGGNSKSRNPHMQTILRLVGYGDNAGSGFPTILEAWKNEGWEEPILSEDTILNQVTLTLKMEDDKKGSLNSTESAESGKSADKSAESSAESGKSADKSAESSAEKVNDVGIDEELNLSENYNRIIALLSDGKEYSSEQIAEQIGLKGSRTRQLLNELVKIGKISYTTKTKNRRYILATK